MTNAQKSYTVRVGRDVLAVGMPSMADAMGLIRRQISVNKDSFFIYDQDGNVCAEIPVDERSGS